MPTRTPVAQLADDIALLGGFQAGKLVSHAVLGALLGGLGSVVQMSVDMRTWLQLLAGAVIIAFGLAQLGVPGFRNIVIEPPLSWMRIVLDRRLAPLTGIVVLITGLYTLTGGLSPGGSPLAASRLTQVATTDAPPASSTTTLPNGHQTVVVTATTGACIPSDVQPRADLPTPLIVPSENAQGCVRFFIIPSLGVDRILPPRGETRSNSACSRAGRWPTPAAWACTPARSPPTDA